MAEFEAGVHLFRIVQSQDGARTSIGMYIRVTRFLYNILVSSGMW